MRKILNFLILFILSLSCALAGCAPKPKTELVVFAAGSLIKPFNEIERAFEAENPDIDVRMEYHGSIQVIRHVSELHEPIDVVATADHNLIPLLMYDVNNPDTGQPYANWYLRLATNKLAIAYTPTSKYADEINAGNWYEILSRPDVKIGLADPRFDAAGYRALMVFKLAEGYYDEKTIFAHMFGGQFQMPIRANNESGIDIIKVPEILETKPDSHILLRGSSIMLVSLLQSGDIDYAFEYESVIKQDGFQVLDLPGEINMGVEEFVSNYETVQVDLDFKRFATVSPKFTGDQIGYGITIPTNAPHADAAVRFIRYLLDSEGREIMLANYHPVYEPVIADGYDNLPDDLKNGTIAVK